MKPSKKQNSRNIRTGPQGENALREQSSGSHLGAACIVSSCALSLEVRTVRIIPMGALGSQRGANRAREDGRRDEAKRGSVCSASRGVEEVAGHGGNYEEDSQGCGDHGADDY